VPVEHKRLGAGEDQVRAVALGRHRNALRIPTPGLFDVGQRQPAFPRGNIGKERRSLLGRTGPQHHFGTKDHGREVGHREERPPHLLHEDPRLEAGEPGATELLGDRHGLPSLLGDLTPQVFVEPLLGLHEPPYHGGRRLVLQEAACRVPQHLLFFTEGEIHGAPMLDGGIVAIHRHRPSLPE
jgi:hypothetical protein